MHTVLEIINTITMVGTLALTAKMYHDERKGRRKKKKRKRK